MPGSIRVWQGLGLLLAIALLIMVMVFWGSLLKDDGVGSHLPVAERETLETPPVPPSDYVGGEACRRCHQTIWERYQSHPMSRSSASADQGLPHENLNATFRVSMSIGEMEYRVEKSQEGVFHHESLDDDLLGRIYDQKVQVAYEVGSGHRGHSYLLAIGDRLYMSPITWYSQQAKWDLSPNYPAGNHPRFERRIPQACIVCHTDRISVSREEPDRFRTPAIPELKISCERCHGPGAGHIAFQESRLQPSAKTSMAVDPIVNPIKLDSERRESVCWQCHMSGEERITRYGRMDSDFRPGMRFDDIWVALVYVTSNGQSGAAHAATQVEQIRSSVCFQRSEGRFGCLSCHDAHSSPSESNKIDFYRQKCLLCHADRGCSVPLEQRTRESAMDSCADCHMPSSALDGIPHTAQIDHRILRKPSPRNTSTGNLPLTIFKPADRELPKIEQDRAWGIAFAKVAEAKRDREFAEMGQQKLNSIRPSVSRDTQLLEWLGVCELILGRIDQARNCWSELLKIRSKDENALMRLADLAITQRDLTAARDALERYLEVNPCDGRHHAQLASIYGSLGDFAAAIRHANEALHINPTLFWAHGILAEVYKRQGNQSEAVRHQRLFQRLQQLK